MFKKNEIIVYSIGLFTILLDQLTKFLVMKNMDIAKEVSIIPNFLSLFYVENTGAAFSSFLNQQLFLIIISILFLVVLIILIRKEKYTTIFSHISLGILLGGMIGNLIDRLFLGAVVDFISVTIFGYKFAVFNIADMGITCGVAIYLISCIIMEIKKEEEKNNGC